MTVTYLPIFDSSEQAGQEPLVRDEASFYSAFEQVKDGRNYMAHATFW